MYFMLFLSRQGSLRLVKRVFTCGLIYTSYEVYRSVDITVWGQTSDPSHTAFGTSTKQSSLKSKRIEYSGGTNSPNRRPKKQREHFITNVIIIAKLMWFQRLL